MGSLEPPPALLLSPGNRLDRYELLRVLAQGGMGTVWLARLTAKHGFERLVALKTILASYGGDHQFCDMFLDEARIAAQVDHENVARIFEFGEDRGVLYHAMELVDGESLRNLYRDIRQVGAPFPLAVALRIAADVCAGLHAVHELRGPTGAPLEVVHRDVSPQNILVTVRGTIKVIDFGVAMARERRTEATTAGTLKGKIEYMAPEQARGERVDRRADVYAVGAVLYELLAGAPVRDTVNGKQLVALHELTTGVPYAPLPPSIALPIRTLVDRALSFDPDRRYRTADDMRRALEHAMLTIGNVATADAVANVLAHFSSERITRRRDAIEAAVRASQPLSSESEGSGMHTIIAPLSAPAPGQMAMQKPLIAPGINVPGSGRLIGDGPQTGPSMLSIEGTEISRPAARPGSRAAKVFAASTVAIVIAVLALVGGVLVSRTSATDAVAPDRPAVTDVPAAANVESPPETSSEPVVPPVAVESTGGIGVVIGASDAGPEPEPDTPASSPSSKVTPGAASAPGKHVEPKKSKSGVVRPPGKKSTTDDYGF